MLMSTATPTIKCDPSGIKENHRSGGDPAARGSASAGQLQTAAVAPPHVPESFALALWAHSEAPVWPGTIEFALPCAGAVCVETFDVTRAQMATSWNGWRQRPVGRPAT